MVSLIPPSYADQSKLTLGFLHSNYDYGEKIILKGKLSDSEGIGIRSVTVWVVDDDLTDRVIKSDITSARGEYQIVLDAQLWDGSSDRKVEFYVWYPGDGRHSAAFSVKKEFNVNGGATASYSSGSSSYSSGSSNTYNSASPTQISITSYPTYANSGQTIQVSGKLLVNGYGLGNTVVKLKDEDFIGFDDYLSSSTTKSDGSFTINWNVQEKDSDDNKIFANALRFVDPTFSLAPLANGFLNAFEEGTVELYVTYGGSDKYLSSDSCRDKYTSDGYKIKCKNNVLFIKDQSGTLESRILNQALGNLVPGSGVLTNDSELLFSALQGNRADSEKLIEKVLLNAISDQTGISSSNLNTALSLVEESTNYNNFRAAASTGSSSYNLDSDYDGIYDKYDYCKYDKETFNGYKDSDGCPDKKPDDWKKKSVDFQSRVNLKINAMKPGVYEAERSLQGQWFSDANAKKELDKAWADLWWAKKYLEEAEWTQKEGERFISQGQYQNAYYKYSYSWEKVNNITNHLYKISNHLTYANDYEYGN